MSCDMIDAKNSRSIASVIAPNRRAAARCRTTGDVSSLRLTMAGV